MKYRPLTGWCLTTGKQGHEQQALGILESLVRNPVVKRVFPRNIESLLAPYLPVKENSEICQPWPDIVITSGRQSAAYAKLISKRSAGRTFTVILQDPKAPPSWFDFLWVNTHDSISGPNVMKTLTTPHRITPQRLCQDQIDLIKRIKDLPSPYIALILGGANSVYPFTLDDAKIIGRETAQLAKKRNASILITPSRRTGKDQLYEILKGLENSPHWVWNEKAKNPYFGILGLCQEIIVTCDSVNMMSEAVSTGKPVHITKLRKKRKSKFDGFHQALIETGAVRWLNEMNNSWTYRPINSHQMIVNEILYRYHDKLKRLEGE
ncbi:mitochondrial fission ELM1 family protein [Candidatus Endowatersipora endosymbiont of Watersipora subatra]|uniref:mitochondrial fission ELM1 family protein n=1 Tax=Candidatus Endowatersipora endosymbiont of Watersipora subatra TaxID=3077946 RepID=UPI00312C9EC1